MRQGHVQVTTVKHGCLGANGLNAWGQIQVKSVEPEVDQDHVIVLVHLALPGVSAI